MLLTEENINKLRIRNSIIKNEILSKDFIFNSELDSDKFIIGLLSKVKSKYDYEVNIDDEGNLLVEQFYISKAKIALIIIDIIVSIFVVYAFGILGILGILAAFIFFDVGKIKSSEKVIPPEVYLPNIKAIAADYYLNDYQHID